MTPIRKRLAFGLLVVLAWSSLAAWHGRPARAELVGGGGGLGSRQTLQSQSAVAASPGGAFAIAGSVDGLYPGLTKPLTLTITNPQHFAIVVTSLTVTAGDASPGCSAGNVAVTPFSGTLAVGAQATASVTLEITLVHQAPDACQAAVFPLGYRGTAVKR